LSNTEVGKRRLRIALLAGVIGYFGLVLGEDED